MRIDAGAWSPWGRAVRLTRQIDAILYAEFARRRKEGVEGRADVLSMLLAARYENEQPLPDNVIRDEMYTLMLAGHETTAATMAWVINRLVTHPDVMERARAEVFSVLDGKQLDASHVGKLKYVEAVINETMRLDPVIPNFGRTLTRPLKIAGRDLPAGVTIAPCIYLVHRRPELWPNPEQFNPDRFLEVATKPVHLLPLRRRRAQMPGRSLRDVSDENRDRRNPIARGPEASPRLQSERHPPRHRIRTE